jgi:glycosyltransferase involved in cell wall biosynthesis
MNSISIKKLSILGTRGIPANHGGFETFAERLALYLAQRGWEITVYCQGNVGQAETIVDTWQGVQRITIPVSRSSALGTIEFDCASIRDVVRRQPPLVLTLGYNTAIFCTYLRWRGITNLINMDGLEWRRDKWRLHERVWLWLNERIACWTGNHLIADHPAIATHLATRVKRHKITTIPYGADAVGEPDRSSLEALELDDTVYGLVIARPEPENSVLEIVTAFSRRPRGAKLVVLGKYDTDTHNYHREVLAAASEEVIFPGAIYNKTLLCALRRHAQFYVHGHRVGGTNPSLVEALGAKNAIIAHDNVFNRWVAGPDARFFATESDCDMHISALLADPATARAMSSASKQRFEGAFRWEGVLAQYEALLDRHLVGAERHSPTQLMPAPSAAQHALSSDTCPPAASRNSSTAQHRGMAELETEVD